MYYLEVCFPCICDRARVRHTFAFLVLVEQFGKSWCVLPHGFVPAAAAINHPADAGVHTCFAFFQISRSRLEVLDILEPACCPLTLLALIPGVQVCAGTEINVSRHSIRRQPLMSFAAAGVEKPPCRSCSGMSSRFLRKSARHRLFADDLRLASPPPCFFVGRAAAWVG